ncbi:hypothetical protein ACOMYX_22055 (plasmid) [Pantoea agglomerans]
MKGNISYCRGFRHIHHVTSFGIDLEAKAGKTGLFGVSKIDDLLSENKYL